jgi:hypothetical protein
MNDDKQRIRYIVVNRKCVRDDWTERQQALACLLQLWVNEFSELPSGYSADEIERALDRSRTDFIAAIATEVCDWSIIPEPIGAIGE